ncbi:MAG: fatty acid desaturase [Chitinophagaceae bacterium]|nr:fatty acid desaturase [Chitinophagaceae bacterium]
MSAIITNSEIPAFHTVLYKRINDYFRENNRSKKAGFEMWFKIWVGLFWYFGSYACIYIFTTGNWSFFWLYLFHGLSHVYLVFNIAHDANHHAISHKPWVNKTLSYTFDACGINSYLWRILHHDQHHYCMNVHGQDETLAARGFFRFTPHTPKRIIHRFQHLYFPFVYGFLTLDWVFVKDFDYFVFKKSHLAKGLKHPAREYVIMAIAKALYLTWMIVLPIVVLGISFWWVAIAFTIAGFVIGLTASIVVQIVHPNETADFPKTTNEYDHYVFYVLGTTADYAAKSPIANSVLGGLNLHVIHHLFPQICHTHFPAVTKIIKATAGEYGITYREAKTMYGSIVQHYRLLKQLATEPYIPEPSGELMATG